MILLLCTQPLCVCSVAQSCLTLCEPISSGMPGFSLHAISQARILEWATISSSGGPSRPRDWICISCFPYVDRRILHHCAHVWKKLTWTEHYSCGKFGLHNRTENRCSFDFADLRSQHGDKLLCSLWKWVHTESTWFLNRSTCTH